MAEPVDAGDVAPRLRAALSEAEDFARAMPAGKEGLLFLQDGQPVQPNATQLSSHEEMTPRR